MRIIDNGKELVDQQSIKREEGSCVGVLAEIGLRIVHCIGSTQLAYKYSIEIIHGCREISTVSLTP